MGLELSDSSTRLEVQDGFCTQMSGPSVLLSMASLSRRVAWIQYVMAQSKKRKREPASPLEVQNLHGVSSPYFIGQGSHGLTPVNVSSQRQRNRLHLSLENWCGQGVKEGSDSTQLWSRLPQGVFICGMSQLPRADCAVSEDLTFISSFSISFHTLPYRLFQPGSSQILVIGHKGRRVGMAISSQILLLMWHINKPNTIVIAVAF